MRYLIVALVFVQLNVLGQAVKPDFIQKRNDMNQGMLEKQTLADLVVQRGHSEGTFDVVFTPDGKRLITSGTDQSIKVWDVASGRIVRILVPGGSFFPISLEIDPEGQFLLVGTSTNRTDHRSPIYLWELASGVLLQTFHGHQQAVTAVRFHPDGKKIVSASKDKTVRIWDRKSGKLIKTIIGNEHPINAMALDAQGKYAYTGGGEKKPFYIAKYGEPNNPPPGIWELTQWELKSGKRIRKYYGIKEEIHEIGLSSNNALLAAGSNDGHLYAFSTANGYKKYTYKLPGRRESSDVPAYAIGIDPSETLMAIGGAHNQFDILDLKSGTKKYTIAPQSDLSAYGTNNFKKLVFSPEPGLIASTNHFVDWIDVHNYKTGEKLIQLTGESTLIPYLVEVDPTGRYAAISYDEGKQGAIKLLNLQTGWIEKNLTSDGVDYYRRKQLDKTNRWFSLAFSPDGKRLTAGGETNKSITWDIATGEIVSRTYGRGVSGWDRMTSIDYSSDGKKLLTTVGTIADLDVPFQVTSLEEGGRSFETQAHYRRILHGRFLYHGRQFATSGGTGGLKIWDSETYKLQKEIQTDSLVEKFEFTPLGSKVICITASNRIQAIDMSSGKVIYTIGEGKWYDSDYTYSDIKIHPDGKTFVVSPGQFSKAYDLLIYNVSDGKLIKRLPGHNYHLNGVDFTPDGKSLISTSSDGTVKLWDLASGKDVLTMVATDGIGHISSIAGNYYLATKSAIKIAAFRFEDKVYPFEQFDLSLNRPDLVVQATGYAKPELINAYKRAYEKRLKKMQFTEEMISSEFQIPKVSIVNTDLPASTKSRSFSLNIEAEDQKYDIDRVNVYINDVPIFGMNGKSYRAKKKSQLKETIPITLSAGHNKIQVSVHNSQGIESLKETVDITLDVTAASNTYVVAIGISDYKNDAFDLNYAAKDAQDIAAKFGTDAARVFSITDGKAIKEKVLAIKSELMKSKIDDRVVLFVAGHGLLDENLDYYIGMHDVDFENPAARGLPYEQLEGLLDGIPARKKLMFIDACHSGEVDKDDAVITASSHTSVGTVQSRGFAKVTSRSESLGLENSFKLMQELFADLRKGTGAVVISSASGAEYALESDAWKNGVFTYSILEGLEGRKCDTNKDGAVQVSELKDYVFDRVAELTNGKQHPTSRRENLEHDFVVW